MNDFYVVGVGTSAGGIDALTQMLGSFKGNQENLCVIVVQHLSPNYKSELTAILSRVSNWPVLTAEDELEVKAHHIYVTPPNKSIKYFEGKLTLGELSPKYSHSPSIDEFLISLAENEKNHAIGIVLSGTGADGSKGIKAIKELKGLTIAQTPDSAQYSDMPLAAIHTDAVDMILHPSRIFEEINFYIKNHRTIREMPPAQNSIHYIFDLLSKRSGVDFSHYKSNTMLRRIDKRIEAMRLKSPAEYYQLLQQNPVELDTLFDTVLIGVTEFFRDPEAFEKLRSVLSASFKQKKIADSIRVWCVGCATGEEPYSIAILMHELLGSDMLNFHFQIFATDIDERALSKARKGIYDEKSVEKVPPELLDKYFDNIDGEYCIKKSIKQHVLFSRHDITNDPPFVKLDLIVCRNLLIYFNNYLQKETFKIFNYALKEDGLLFLGKSESVSVTTELFTKADGLKLFRKIHAATPINLRFSRYKMRVEAEEEKSSSKIRGMSLVDIGKETLYFSSQHPFVIISEQGDIKEAQGSLRLYIEINQGTTNTNIYKMANKELVTQIRSLMAQSKKNASMSESPVIKFNLFEKEHYVRLKLTPLIYPSGGLSYYILSFEEVTPDPLYLQLSRELTDKEVVDYRVRELEQEVYSLREQLQTFTEELETSNEEMQAINEELQSSNEELKSANEELETSNEELQSANEELQTANNELRLANSNLIEKERELQIAKDLSEKNGELYRAVAENIPNGTVGILNDQYEIEYIAGKGLEAYNIKPEEVIGKNLPLMNPSEEEQKKLIKLFNDTLKGKPGVTVFNFNSRSYSLQTIPVQYNGDNAGKKLMYLTQDMTDKLLTQRIITETELKFRALADNIPNLCWMAKEDGWIYWYNNRWYEYTGTTLEEMKGWGWESVHDPEMLPEVNKKWNKAIKEKSPFEMVFPLKGKDGIFRHFLTRIVPVFDKEGKFWQWFGTNTDVSEQEKLNRLKDEFIGIASHELKTPIASIKGYIQLINEWRTAGLDIPVDKVIHNADRQAGRLTGLINDLLDATSLQAGKMKYHFSEFSLQALVNDAILQFNTEINRHYIELKGNLSFNITGDKNRLGQVITNLLSNAIKYSPDAEKVILEVTSEGEKVKISVRDFGIGIPGELKPHIFERFYRVEKTSHNFQGMGLGLFISSEIIRQHHGEMNFESNAGKGSTFWFTIPKQNSLKN